MTVYKQDYAAAKTILWPDEVVEVTATQRQFGPGGSAITPTTIVATDKRVIIINRTTMGMRKDIESIPYHRITSVRFEKGIISSSVFLRIEGYSNPTDELIEGKEWGEIDGLQHYDAKAITDFINKKLSELNAARHGQNEPHRDDEHAARYHEAPHEGAIPAAGAGGGPSGYIYCNECGFRNPIDSHFCGECGHKMR